MNCQQHPDRPATAFCRNCGRALCGEDQREVYGVVFCRDCLARHLGLVAPPPPVAAAPGANAGRSADAGLGAGAAGAAAAPDPTASGPGVPPPPPAAGAPGGYGRQAGFPGAHPLDAPNPGVALGLGFIPGVGAIYNGQYFKAFIQVVIFGFLVYMSNLAFGPIFGIGAFAFYFYMVLDSYRTARAISLGQPTEDFPGMGQVKFSAPLGAVVLIVIGGILLLRSMDFFNFDVLRYFWPVLLIVIGVLLLERRRRADH